MGVLTRVYRQRGKQGNCQVQDNSGGLNLLQIKHLIIQAYKEICVRNTHIARKSLDLMGIPAILALGCEEC